MWLSVSDHRKQIDSMNKEVCESELVNGKESKVTMFKSRKWIPGVCIMTAAALLFTGCGFQKKSSKVEKKGNVSAGTVVMMVGDAQVRYSEVMAYSYFLKCQYESSFGKELWKYQLGSNETIGDQAKQEIVNMITQLKIISAVAQKQSVGLTADEQDEALRQAEDLVHNASAADKEQYSLTVQEISEIYQENLLAEKMFYVATDDADTNVTDEEAGQAIVEDNRSKAASGSAVKTASGEESSFSKEEIDKKKEQIIQQRQSEMFVKKYNQWLRDKKVDINQSFWNDFNL